MSSAGRFAIPAVFLLALASILVPARGQDSGRDSTRPAPPAAAIGDGVHDPARETAHDTGHACLDQKERRAESRQAHSAGGRHAHGPGAGCPGPWCGRGYAAVTTVSSMC